MRGIVGDFADVIGNIPRLIDRQRPRQGRAGAGGGNQSHRGDIDPMPAVQEAEKASQCGKMLGARRCHQLLVRQRRQPRPHIRRPQRRQVPPDRVRHPDVGQEAKEPASAWP